MSLRSRFNGKKIVLFGVCADYRDGILHLNSKNGSFDYNLSDLSISCEIDKEKDFLILKTSHDEIKSRTFNSIFGTTFRRISSSVKGLANLHNIDLQMSGVGFKVSFLNSVLFFNLGFSHIIAVFVPPKINIVISESIIKFSSPDLCLVSSFVSYLKSIKKVEPYGGNGLFIHKEYILRKEAKSGSGGK